MSYHGVARTPHGMDYIVSPRRDVPVHGPQSPTADMFGDDHKDEHRREEPPHTTSSSSSSRSQRKKKRKKPRHGSEFFPPSELEPKYEFVRYLGHGSYGHVAEGRRITDGLKVALKKVPNVFRNPTDAKRLLRELVILRTLQNSQAIVSMLDIFCVGDLSNFDTLYLVFEFVDTDLAQLISSEQHFQDLHVKYIMYQILLGLKYMHSAGIVHRDLKPANILVNEDVTCKICDFGLARSFQTNEEEPQPHSHHRIPHREKKHGSGKRLSSSKRTITSHVVTRWYRAPEVILLSQQRAHLTAIDMWSVGCILSELLLMIRENARNPQARQPLFPGRSCFPLSAKDPFAFNDRSDQLKLIFEVIGTPTDEEIAKISDEKAQQYLYGIDTKIGVDLRAKFPGSSFQSIDLLRRLLMFDVEKRITVEQALAHPYLEAVRDLDAERRHDTVTFEFEDVDLTIETITELIVDEIVRYNPHLEQTLLQRSASVTSESREQRESSDNRPPLE